MHIPVPARRARLTGVSMSRTELVVMAVLAAACGGGARPDAAALRDAAVGSAQNALEVSAPVAGARASVVAEAIAKSVPPALTVATTSADSTSVARMIVRSAELSLQVSDVRKAAQQVADATTRVGGFLGASRLWREGEMDRSSMTVRVPSATLDSTLARLRQLAVRVDNESVTGEDVTRQAVDLTAQLTNLRATEAELRALLTTVRIKTQRASDVLEVHRELARVRGEIDQHAAELQSLTQLAALSTITIDLRPDVVATPIATETWQPRGVLRDAVRALADTGRVVVNAGIWLLVWSVPLLLVAIVVRGLFNALRAHRRVVS